jgi:bla regulator protein blaR1
MDRRAWFTVTIAAVTLTGVVIAQGPEPRQFEVASVKPNRSGQLAMNLRVEPGGRLIVQNLSLKDLVTVAYRVRDFQVIGGPSWMAVDRFDVTAKADHELPPMRPDGAIGPLELMLQRLLAERFKFVASSETQDRPMFALVMARTDRRLGERMQPSTVDCAALLAERSKNSPPAQGPVMNGQRPVCGMAIAPWAMRLGAVPMSQLADVLSQMTNRYVEDQTGLTGRYNIDLEWTPPGGRGAPPAGDGSAPPVPVPRFNANGATLETAIQEQLGLKLEPRRGPVPVLRVERAEPPTPD